MFSIAEFCFLFVLGLAIYITNGFHIENNEIRKECWEQYAAIKLCSPKYDQCIISMSGECLEKFQSCSMTIAESEISRNCHTFLSNFTKSLKMNEVIHPLELLKETIGFGEKQKEKERCDMAVFKYHDFSPHDLSELALQAVSQLPLMISTYCQCPKFETKESFTQSSKSSVSNHFWYGGFRNYGCWKEVDRNLAEKLCGETTSLFINHEWAKRADCIENPKWMNCTLRFIESLKMFAKSSGKPLFCFVYAEIIEKYLKLFNGDLFDYKVVYLNEQNSLNFDRIPYRSEELYLFEHTNDKTEFQCFPVKRTLISCKLLYISNNSQEHSYIKCIEENEHLVPECVFSLLQKESFRYLSGGLFKLVWDHKWTTLVFVLIGTFCALCKKVRDWILKLLAISACIGVTKSFMSATEYSEKLLNKRRDPRIRTETLRTTLDEESSDESTNNYNERETFSTNNQEWQSLAPISQETDDSVSVIGLDPQTLNNQQEDNSTNAQNNCENAKTDKKDESKESSENPEITASFTVLWTSFSDMVRSSSQVINTLYITPSFKQIKESIVNYFATPRTNGNVPV